MTRVVKGDYSLRKTFFARAKRVLHRPSLILAWCTYSYITFYDFESKWIFSITADCNSENIGLLFKWINNLIDCAERFARSIRVAWLYGGVGDRVQRPREAVPPYNMGEKRPLTWCRCSLLRLERDRCSAANKRY